MTVKFVALVSAGIWEGSVQTLQSCRDRVSPLITYSNTQAKSSEDTKTDACI